MSPKIMRKSCGYLRLTQRPYVDLLGQRGCRGMGLEYRRHSDSCRKALNHLYRFRGSGVVLDEFPEMQTGKKGRLDEGWVDRGAPTAFRDLSGIERGGTGNMYNWRSGRICSADRGLPAEGRDPDRHCRRKRSRLQNMEVEKRYSRTLYNDDVRRANLHTDNSNGENEPRRCSSPTVTTRWVVAKRVRSSGGKDSLGDWAIVQFGRGGRGDGAQDTSSIAGNRSIWLVTKRPPGAYELEGRGEPNGSRVSRHREAMSGCVADVFALWPDPRFGCLHRWKERKVAWMPPVPTVRHKGNLRAGQDGGLYAQN